jgi:hypothetical protein
MSLGGPETTSQRMIQLVDDFGRACGKHSLSLDLDSLKLVANTRSILLSAIGELERAAHHDHDNPPLPG